MDVLSQSTTDVTKLNGIITTTSSASKKKDQGTDSIENLWSSILSEVQNQGSTKLPSNKSVLVLGDNATGKTTMIAKLQGVEDPKKGSGLEYAYIDVRDEYRDDLTRLSVWVLDGDPGHVNLLKYALNETNYMHTLVILTVSMTTPWSWKEQLEHWIKILNEHVHNLNIDPEVRKEAENRLKVAWQNYCENGDDLDVNSPMSKRTARLSSVDDEMLPLPDEVLTRNLGLDIVVVVTKTDYMTTLEKEYDYRDEYFDFMQQWIRRFCLQHGASLFYTSVKEDKNCDLLYKYLTHRIYDLPFRTPALVVEKDAVLIPAGWDNLNKVSILYENMHSCKAEDFYTDVIAPPPQRKTVSKSETEVQTEDEQQFLARQQQILMQGQTQTRGESPMRTPPSTAKSMPRTSMDAKLPPGSATGEGVLANFFNSLLNKKGNAPGSPGSPASVPRTNGVIEGTPDRNTMRTDAAAELDRLTRSVKKESDSSEC